MIDVLRHRGPDGQRVWLSPDGSFGLAHARLSIVDLSPRGNQPMANEDDSLWLTCNGEIYNHRVLRDELVRSGHRFRSGSDNEVILHGYEQWGHRVLERLRGMFAFAIADVKRGELFAARDRLGEKPLIFCEDTHGVAGASEVPALLAGGRGSGPIDPRAISYMLARNLRHVPEPLCAFSRMRKLPPAHFLLVRGGRISAIERWWTPSWRGAVSEPADLRRDLTSAVELEYEADVEVGALLSGGVDSSAVVGLAGTQASGMRTYALGRDEHDEELRRAAAAAQRFGTRHSARTFSRDQLGRLDALIRQLGEPIALLPLTHADALMSDVAADGLRVVLTGNGADELLWGYDGVARLRRLSATMGAFDRLPLRVRSLAAWDSGVLGLPLRQRKTELYRRAVAGAAELLRPELRDAALMPSRCPVFAPWAEAFDGSSYAELSQFLTLMVEDAHSVTISGDLVGMHHSVEVRSPFLDVDVVQTALRLPEREKGGSLFHPEGKRVLKRGLRDVIGAEAAQAPKMGFGHGIQESELLRTVFRDDVSGRLIEGVGVGNYFDRAAVMQRLDDHLNRRGEHGKLLLSLYAFDVWHEAFEPYLG
jgi:asparagine synthase (glutamine-hydrolysing)